MHYGIAQFIKKNPGMGEEEVAKQCGVSPTILRQAKMRYTLILGDPVKGGEDAQ
jgi:hypothetical protein